jgi:aerobic-type carbon monoxide dehydrogenase small subunit (CoxS/CutS family)
MAMAAELRLRVNDKTHTISATPETPLLYVLSDELALQGPRFGCGLGQCGCCSVLADGAEIRSCITPVSRVANKSITTLEGLPAYYASKMKLKQIPELHPLQSALIAEQAVQCGYCYNGQIIKGAELLFKNPAPSEVQIRAAMNGHLCRCGTYPRILQAIQRASKSIVALFTDSAHNAARRGGESVALGCAWSRAGRCALTHTEEVANG